MINLKIKGRFFLGSFNRPFMEDMSCSYIPTITAIVPPDTPGIVIVEPIHKAFRIVFSCIENLPIY